jgi:transposase-like protein
MKEKTIKRSIIALAHTRVYLNSQIAQAYDSDDMVLYAILREARSVLEDGIDELSGAGATPSSELDSIPNDEAWWDESRQTSID